LALALYWPGLVCWFQKDDFVGLNLFRLAQGEKGYLWALFAPIAQGTTRTLSERIFFMSLSAVFGPEPLPYRCVAFLTFIASLILLGALCSKLTGSRVAGFWAMILWTANSALGYVLSWTAIYYQILCAFFFLAGIWLLVRYAETGKTRFYVAQWATFLLGFGVLEVNVVYPALAAMYALCCVRRIFWKTLPMFAVSALFAWWHTRVAPLPSSGPYKLYWDASIFSTLWTYWKWALGPSRLIFLRFYPSPFRSLLTVALMAGLLGFLAWKLYRRQWVAAFFPAWFLIVFGPFLPLRDHIDASYLTVPLIGLAMWGGWGVASGWKAGRAGKIAAAALLAVYLCVSIPLARVVVDSFYDRSVNVRNLVLGVVDQVDDRTDKLVLLTGVDQEMFVSAIWHHPFEVFDLNNVWLSPGGSTLDMPAEYRAQFYANPEAVTEALKNGRALVLDVTGGQVRDITREFARTW